MDKIYIYPTSYLAVRSFVVNGLPLVGAFLNENIVTNISRQDFKTYSTAGKAGAILIGVTAVSELSFPLTAIWIIGNLTNYMSLNHCSYINHEANHHPYETSLTGLEAISTNFEY